ncbi:hypothetical protein FIC_00635 [Flavobacteriaceae bacterium 3519-10]|nr:hypothetical protein FIC_00635 [Flavobacteriaceae bacterium 3519-10]
MLAANVWPLTEVADERGLSSSAKIMFLREIATSGYRKLGNFG